MAAARPGPWPTKKEPGDFRLRSHHILNESPRTAADLGDYYAESKVRRQQKPFIIIINYALHYRCLRAACLFPQMISN